ncbi:hypothetical protein Dimus_028577 [Dionaea muscipula]
MSRRGLPLKARVLGVGLKEGVEEVGGRSGKDAKTPAEEAGLEARYAGRRFRLDADLGRGRSDHSESIPQGLGVIETSSSRRLERCSIRRRSKGRRKRGEGYESCRLMDEQNWSSLRVTLGSWFRYVCKGFGEAT